jgi:hypothetical protein
MMNVSIQADNSRLARADSKMTLFGSVAVFCVAVPGFASLKALLILGSWTYLIVMGRLHVRSIFWLLSVMCNLIIWYEVALFNSVATADLFNQFSRLFVFFIVLSIGVLTVRAGTIDRQKLDRIIVWISSLSAALKVGILVLVVGGWYSMDAVQSALGFETVTDNIGLGLQRLQFPSDIILVFLIACYVGGRNKAFDLLLLLGVTVSVVLSFSRYLFAAYVVCMILRALGIRKLDTVSRASLVMAGVLLLLFSDSLANRFTGSGTSMSDEIRTVQIRALTDVIVRHLSFGTGIGSSVNGFKRSETLPFSYEVEWYALIMQFGFLGIVWFVGNLVAPLISCLKFAKGKLFLILLFVLWAVSGFTNPYVTSLGSAFGLCILMLRFAQGWGGPSDSPKASRQLHKSA